MRPHIAFLAILVLHLAHPLISQPNLVIFLVDDLGWGDLGYTGHPTTSSPNVDKLARNGKVFTQFYAGSPVCTPSRATLLTGRHSVRSGMYPHVQFPFTMEGLPLEEVTLAELMKEQGYATGMVGKWHLGVGPDGQYLPTHQGFDSYLGIPYSHDMCPFVLGCYPGEACDAESPHKNTTSPCPLFEDDRIVEQPTDFTTLTEKFSQFSEQFVLDNVLTETPFFLFFSFHHVHFPQFSSSNFRNTSLRGAFGDAVAEMDAAVGNLVSTLEEVGALDDTLIIFTSDNGPRSFDQGKGQGGNSGPFKCGKGTTWEGGQRVPAIVHWPNQISSGKENGLMSTLDVLPTVMGSFGFESSMLDNVVMDGFDLSDTLLNEASSDRDHLVYIHTEAVQEDGIHALRHKQYKAHFITQGFPFSKNEDLECSAQKQVHETPILFNVEHDTNERYPLTVENEPNYNQILTTMLEMKEQIEQQLTWEQPRNFIFGDEAIPCCSRGCEPFPSCCTCSDL